MASILQCPAEILGLIVDHLSASDRAAMCRAHSYLRAITEPRLYSTVEWTAETPYWPHMLQFIHTIIRRPQLADFIKCVLLTRNTPEWTQNDNRNEVPKLPISEVDLDGLADCVKAFEVSYSDQWIEALKQGTMDAFIALLLSLLPNIEGFHIGRGFSRQTHFIGMMLRSSLCETLKANRLPCFQKVSSANIVCNDPGDNDGEYKDLKNTDDVLPLFYLPGAVFYTLLIDNPVIFSWPGANPPNATKLRSLRLMMLREGHLGHILSATPNLQKLDWEWLYRPDLRDAFVTDTIDLDQISEDLSHIRDTLIELSVTGKYSGCHVEPETPRIYFNGSFNTFSNLNILKVLEVPLPFLVGFSRDEWHSVRIEDALPKSLEWLIIMTDMMDYEQFQWTDLDVLDLFQRWLEDWKNLTPDLRGVRFHRNRSFCELWGPAVKKDYVDLGVRAGISIVISGEI
jgi:hypothetical protein